MLNSGRYALSGVRAIDLQDGRYRLEATDGKRLVIIHGSSVAPAVGSKETFAALELAGRTVQAGAALRGQVRSAVPASRGLIHALLGEVPAGLPVMA